MLEYNISSVRHWKAFSTKRQEGHVHSVRFIGRLAKVSQLIDKLNTEEKGQLGWFVGEGVA